MLAIKRVLVTGASGKLGRPLCKALLEKGYRVTALRHHAPVAVDGAEETRADLGDAGAVREMVSRQDAIIHLATCKEDREGVIEVSARGTFNLLDAAMRTGAPKRFILASGDAVNGIYFNRQPVPLTEDVPFAAYPGYYSLSKVIEETMCRQFFIQAAVPTVCLRFSWIHAEDDILNHLTLAGEAFGIPIWKQLMDAKQLETFAAGRNAAVALRHPDGSPFLRHIVAVEDCVQAFLLALQVEGIEGQTFNIAMAEPFDYPTAAAHAARQLSIETIPLTDPVGHDFWVDISRARYILGYRPQYDICKLIDQAAEFRRSGRKRGERSGYKG
jgi:nucleoside-diphosphate-sugar epimerase